MPENSKIAVAVEVETEDTQHGKFLTFMIGDEIYGIEITAVIEIVNIQPITFVPHVPDFVKGIINLRGKVVPVVDMRLKFKKPARDYDERTCIIILEIHEIMIGVIIDRVSDVLYIADDQISDMPLLKAAERSAFVRNIANVGDKAVLILDSEKIV
jgi:purine-binding chemotaxis protein CheW